VSASPRGYWTLWVVFGACWLIGTVASQGFLEDDAWAHFLYSRTLWNNPAYLADVWGRPVCTGIYALGAWAGMFGCRVVSLVLVLIAAELTRRTARLLAIDEQVSVAFLLAMPVLYLHSLSVMTELPFAVLLIGTFLAYLRRRWWLTALLASLLPLARPEGFGFVLLAGVVLLWRRRFFELPLLVLPLVGWSFYGFAFAKAPDDHSPWLWLWNHWPYSTTSTYGRGWLLQFVVQMPILVGIGMPFLLLGLFSLSRYSRRGRGEGSNDVLTHSQFGRTLTLPSPGISGEGQMLLIAIPLSMLVVHSLLWWLGKMASYGEVRYLLIVAPFWALLAAIGWQRCSVKPSPALLAVVSLLIVAGVKATMLRSSAEGCVAADVAAWATDHSRVMPTHPAVNVYLDRRDWQAWDPTLVQQRPAGLVLIWDRKTGAFNADSRMISDVAGLESLGWEVIYRFDGGWVAMVAKR
jgi:hypothetical protein